MWVIVAFLGAVFKAWGGYEKKKIADAKIDRDVFAWLVLSLTVVLTAPFAVANPSQIVSVATGAWLFVALSALFTLLAQIYNIKALEYEELSYITPLFSLVPVVTLLVAWVTLGEAPPLFGIVGVMIVVVGVYIVNKKPGQVSWFDPLSHVASNKGARYGLLIVVFYACNNVALKYILNTGANLVQILFLTMLTGSVMLAHVPLRKREQLISLTKGHIRVVVAIVLLSLASSFANLLATKLTLTAYASSVRRFDILLTTLISWRVLNESNIRDKLIGGILLTIGVVFVAIA